MKAVLSLCMLVFNKAQIWRYRGKLKLLQVFSPCVVVEASLHIDLVASLLIVRLFQEALSDLYSPISLFM